MIAINSYGRPEAKELDDDRGLSPRPPGTAIINDSYCYNKDSYYM